MLTRRARRLAIGVGVVAAIGAALPLGGRLLLKRWELNPVLRGRLLAAGMGCLACHRPFADIEILNPGSRWGTVPAFQSGNSLMYGTTELSAIEEFIRYGAPRQWLEDPAVRKRLEGQLIRMPAYEDLLSDGEIADLVAFVGVLEGVRLSDAAKAGRQLARETGCLSCHGVEGAGGIPNPGSISGFIPGFLGRNFTDLVRSEGEFREWVLEGTSSRLERHPVARFFWRRQKLQMPAYRGQLSDEEVGLLWDWVVSAREAASG